VPPRAAASPLAARFAAQPSENPELGARPPEYKKKYKKMQKIKINTRIKKNKK
jgi:hypothetical protein